jgi:TolB-like protein
LPDIFLSYSRDDQATARRFAEGFERAGWSVWWDQALHSGEDYDKVTEKALEEARAVVVLWSKKSVDSRWVRAEATQADRNGTLVPAMIEPCKRPIMFELKQTADLSGWSGDPGDKGWLAYLASVRRLVDRGEPVATAPVAPAPDHPRRRGGNGVGIAIGTLALLVVGAGIWALSRRSADPVAPPVVAVNTSVTLAVLPFVNLSSDPEQEYFSDGLTEEILNQLAQIKDLRVTARTSSFAFKGKNEDARVIGEELGVANLLEGSIRKDGNQLRITAQLVGSKDGVHRWSQTYARELKDVFAIQEDIAKDVAEALSIALEVGKASGRKRGTASLEAYDNYLRAAALARQGTVEGARRAIKLSRNAVALDPAFVEAWAGLLATLNNVLVQDPAAGADERREMEVVRAKITSLDPDNPAMHGLRAIDFLQRGEWAESEAEARAAMKLDPANTGGNSLVLLATGRVREALQYIERARLADPLSKGASMWLQIVLDQAGRVDDAQTEYLRSKDLVGDDGAPDWYALRRLWAKSDSPPALVKEKFGLALKGMNQPMELDRFLMERLDDKVAARAAIRKAFDDPASQNVSRLNRIVWYADHFGDKDLALAALRREFIDLHGNYWTYLWDPYETGLRSDVRFKDIVRDLGLVDYWRSSGNWGDFCKPVGKDDFECH